MNVYHAFVSLKPGMSDMDFAAALRAYMEHLREQGRLAGWRLTRRKLGLGPKEMGEFHVMMEFEDLSQLDLAFQQVATRSGQVEKLHHCVNHMVASATFALYRDFPDPVRETGGELF